MYYYPKNLTSETILFNHWNGKNAAVMLILFIAAVLAFLFLRVFWVALVFLSYAILTARLYNGYSLSRLIVLYIKFFITDILIFKWR